MLLLAWVQQGTGNATPRIYIKRKTDDRKAVDTTYRLRYVIPAAVSGSVARPPTSGYVIQESNTSIGSTTTEVATYFGSGSITNVDQQRNFSQLLILIGSSQIQIQQISYNRSTS